MPRPRIVLLVGGGALVVAVMLLLVLSPIDPLAYVPSEPVPLVGPLEPNSRLRAAELLGRNLIGPEDVAVDDRGRIYTGLADGSVRRADPAIDTQRFEPFADTGGRPHGLDFDTWGTLWVADTRLGLLSIDSGGQVTLRSDPAAPIGFANDVAVAADGTVYFSDASGRYSPEQLLLEVLEARPHGRLLQFEPSTESTRVLLDGLYFANGVAVAPDERYVLVAETFRYRVRRLWLDGPQAGRDEVLIDDLPGFPDGIAGDHHGRYWVALYGMRSNGLDRWIHPRPWLKRLIARLPPALRSAGQPYGLVLAIDGDGRILESLHDPGGETIAHVTSVQPSGGALYLGTVRGDRIGRYDLP